MIAPGAKRKSLDHALASLAAPASRTRHDLRVVRKAFRKTMIVRIDGYLGAAARPQREDAMEGEVLVMRCGKWRRGRGGGSARRRRAGGGGGAWRAMPPSQVEGLVVWTSDLTGRRRRQQPPQQREKIAIFSLEQNFENMNIVCIHAMCLLI